MSKVFLSLEKGFFQAVLHCFRCGDCCTRIPPELTQEEIDLIMRRLNRREKQLFKEALTTDPEEADPIDCVRTPLTRAAWIKAPCLFLEEKNGKVVCKIYKFRPEICRVFHCGKKSPDEPLVPLKYSFELSGRFLSFMKEEIEKIEGAESVAELKAIINELSEKQKRGKGF